MLFKTANQFHGVLKALAKKPKVFEVGDYVTCSKYPGDWTIFDAIGSGDMRQYRLKNDQGDYIGYLDGDLLTESEIPDFSE